MPRFRTRPTLALLCALLCLTACAPAAIGSVSPTATATMLPTPTVTPTPVLAPTPTNVPAGWAVLDTPHFSLAYPPDRTPQLVGGRHIFAAPARQSLLVVWAEPQGDVSPYCQSAASEAQQSTVVQHTTFAGLPVTYLLFTGTANTLRLWLFANAQHTLYELRASDANADAATKVQDEAILSTFRPDNADPWHC